MTTHLRKEVEEKQSELQRLLRREFAGIISRSGQDALSEAIKELIDAKIAVAVDDLDDKIYKRGRYDADY